MRVFDEQSMKDLVNFIGSESEEVEGYLYETEDPRWAIMAKVNLLLKEMTNE